MDMLTKLYQAFLKSFPDPTPFQAFQAGLTAGASSMRYRAMDCVKGSDPKINDMKNAIGKLSDIPEK